MRVVQLLDRRWVGADADHPCPVCGKPDWCLIEDSGSTVLCQRVESLRRIGDAGWWHEIASQPPFVCCGDRGDDHPAPTVLFPELRDELVAALTQDRMDAFVEATGLDEQILRQMQMGWASRARAYAFPMRDGRGSVIGIRLRALDGRKWAVRGSTSGIFIAGTPQNDSYVLMPEGPTDTAALAEVGFECWGRPAAMGGGRFIEDRLRLRMSVRQDRPTLVVVADNDEDKGHFQNAGRVGAERLAARLSRYRCPVKVLYPTKGKDAREWVDWGANYETIRSVIDCMPEVKNVGLGL